ncbi:alpha/beta fold hydrolase [Ruegeria sp. HKCCD8929]|uniref:alpha/beta fold hydrolase n=1 Tax=Ruegeria sp. HKCCD8929 TaxID=2683006 RepID=UPI0020C30371|nr:alpha/beta hydrolase [Ruegeria sp. HKCCD8929]
MADDRGGAMMRVMRVLSILGLLLGCSAPHPRPPSAPDPFVYRQEELARAHSIVFLLPGVLTPGQIFDPVRSWAPSGYAPVYYRFPGMDGAPSNYDLVISQAAAEIAAFANRHPGKKIRLIGYSTGAPIALIAAAGIDRDDTRVAAMSSAVEHAGGLRTALNGAADILAAALRSGSLDLNRVWLEYYKTLLFGRDGLRDPDRRKRATQLLEQERDRLIQPDIALSRAQTRDLRRWRLPPVPVLDADRIRFFVGTSDPVFRPTQTRRFARKLGSPRILGYPGHGHVLFVSRPEVFDDIRAFFEEPGIRDH